MQVDEQVSSLLTKVGDGSFGALLSELEGSDFGLYLPLYQEGNAIKLLPKGFSQIETDLEVKVVPSVDVDDLDDMQTVAWVGAPELTERDTRCSHPGTGPQTCRHCTASSHNGHCRHCSGHKNRTIGGRQTQSASILQSASKLDYDVSVAGLDSKHEILRSLASQGFGLALLHGHSEAYKFTQLPRGYVAVVSNGKTDFRSSQEVGYDSTFVPNTWRVIDGELEVAGGISAN